MKNIFLTSTIIIAMASMSNGQTPINLGFDPADPNPPVTPPVEYVPQEFINFNMDGGRDWKLEQKGVGASSSLQLRPMVQGKSFQIVAPNQSHHILNVRIQDSDLNSTVGIGTANANTRLHVKGNARLLRLEGTDHAYQDWVVAGKTTHVGFASSGAASTGAWSIVNNFSNGKIAIDAGTNGFIDLKSNTQVLGDFTVNGKTTLNGGGLTVVHNATDDWQYGLAIYADRDKTKALTVNNAIGTTVFTIWGNGVINAKSLYAEEITVQASTSGVFWPDYVFEPDYNLLSLSETENYILKNKHLPEVPSAEEISNEGCNIVEMNAILLKKIEELTLHIIELEKRLSKVENN